LLKYVAAVVFGLLPIMNPLGTIPLFLALTPHDSAAEERRLALHACLYALAILVAFLFVGNGLIALFGISLASIRVAGGLIILVLAFRMVFSGTSQSVEPGTSATKQ